MHWGIAALLTVSFVSHDAMKESWRAFLKGQESSSFGVPIHVSTGIAILVLVLFRLALRWRRSVPAVPDGGNPILDRVAGLTHWALCGLLILIPVSGLATWFGGVKDAGEVREVLFNIAFVLVALHTAAALYSPRLAERRADSKNDPRGLIGFKACQLGRRAYAGLNFASAWI